MKVPPGLRTEKGTMMREPEKPDGMTILHVISGLRTGGAELMLLKLLDAMDRERFRSVVVSLSTSGHIKELIERHGIRVLSLDARRGSLLWWPFNLKKLVTVTRTVRPNIIHGWMYHGNLAAQFASMCLPYRPTVLWSIRASLQGYRRLSLNSRISIRLGALMSALPRYIIYNSHRGYVDHEAAGYSSRNRLMIPNGFDTEEFCPSRQERDRIRSELGVSDQALIISMIANYGVSKNHATFFLAAQLLARDHVDVRFLLAGRRVDDTNRDLARQVDELGIRRCTYLLGERRDIRSLLAASDIATLSSFGEAFPNVIGEAMACGTPCVATDVGDVARIIGNTGVVVPLADAAALAAGWKRLLDIGTEERLHLGRAARERIIREYNLDKVVHEYQQLYESQVNARRQSVGGDLTG